MGALVPWKTLLGTCLSRFHSGFRDGRIEAFYFVLDCFSFFDCGSEQRVFFITRVNTPFLSGVSRSEKIRALDFGDLGLVSDFFCLNF